VVARDLYPVELSVDISYRCVKAQPPISFVLRISTLPVALCADGSEHTCVDLPRTCTTACLDQRRDAISQEALGHAKAPIAHAVRPSIVRAPCSCKWFILDSETESEHRIKSLLLLRTLDALAAATILLPSQDRHPKTRISRRVHACSKYEYEINRLQIRTCQFHQSYKAEGHEAVFASLNCSRRHSSKQHQHGLEPEGKAKQRRARHNS
jgi:hypothetical protein